jgi:hypothetical protein
MAALDVLFWQGVSDMGWWTVERDGKELDIGDGPLDTVHAALKKVANSYKRDLKRKPTTEELAEIIGSSIRILEEDIFDDMEERELDSVGIMLRPRPKRPRPKPGDYFAIPLPSGGYAYGRIMKITLRVLVWMRLLDVRSEGLLSVDELKKAEWIFQGETGTNWINNLKWPIVGHIPLTDDELEALKSEPQWTSNYPDWGIEKIAEWKLSGKRGLPWPLSAPYDGYRDV